MTSVDLKKIDGQTFLQQTWVYSALAEHGNLGSATIVSHVQVLTQQGKETAFTEGQRKLGARVNKESLAFHWLSPCQERRAVSLLPVGLYYHHRG